MSFGKVLIRRGMEDFTLYTFAIILAFYMNNPETKPEIFTPEERDENEGRKRELIELVASGEAVLIVGAGSSARVGYVTWGRLLEELEDLANQWGVGLNQERKGDALAYAEDIKSHIRDKTGGLGRYYALLQSLFSPKDPPCKDFHRKLVSFPFRGILTTNYDTVLEAALGEIEPHSAYDNSFIIEENSAGRVHEFLMAMNNRKRMTRRIAHLHGRFDLANSIILSIGDYKRAYGLNLADEKSQQENEWKLRFRLLWAVLATRRVVFVGFSLGDPYFEEMLKIVSEDLWTWNKSTHFAIMNISSKGAEDSKDKAERLNNEYGVSAVFYEDSDNLHRGLDQIVDEIHEACTVRSQPTTDQVDWLEEVNRHMEQGIDDEN